MTAAEALAVIGVDPGARWSAGVLRAGDAALWGWTLGPRNDRDQPTALSTVDDMESITRYADRVIAQIDDTIAHAESLGHKRIRIGVESVRRPTLYRSGQRVTIPLSDWVIPYALVMAIHGAYPDARLVPPARNGGRDRLSYPPELQRHRPPYWPANEARRGERDHERAAYDVAGAAAGLP